MFDSSNFHLSGFELIKMQNALRSMKIHLAQQEKFPTEIKFTLSAEEWNYIYEILMYMNNFESSEFTHTILVCAE